LIAPGLADPIGDTIAGAIIGLFVGLVSILAMSIGRGQWRFFFVRLACGAIGGMTGGVAGGVTQALIFPGPRWFLEMLIPLGSITLGAIIGAILCAKLFYRLLNHCGR
jgi:hypothetical protein